MSFLFSSTAILGAETSAAHRLQMQCERPDAAARAACAARTSAGGSGDGGVQLPLWWLLRTYLQSLGSDMIEEMKAPAKLAIFVVMYPIFNVILVRNSLFLQH
jgi:hypothetical protein